MEVGIELEILKLQQVIAGRLRGGGRSGGVAGCDNDVRGERAAEGYDIAVSVFVGPYRSDTFHDRVSVRIHALPRAVQRQCHGFDTRLCCYKKKSW